MFVCSFKTTKVKLAAGLLAVLAAVGMTASYALRSAAPAMAPGGISLAAEDSRQRAEFLRQFGWEVREDPAEVAEVIIPMEFNDVYESYNKLQREQGFDLKGFGGKRVKRWTYTVTNYPGYDENAECIHANILVYEGRVVGGDICSVELSGFMHGFQMQSVPDTAAASETTTATTQTQETATVAPEQESTTAQSKTI